MKCLQALGQAVLKLGVIAIVPILCVPLYYLVGFAFVKEPAPQSVIIRLGNTVLEVPSEVVIEDVYFGKAWTSESRLDHSSSINIELPIFEKSRPSIITLHPFTNEDQLAHPEAVDAYLGNGRYSGRFVKFDGNRGVWEVFSSASDTRQWHVFSQDPPGQTIEGRIPWVAFCYNGSFVEGRDKLTCLSRTKLDGLFGQFRFDYDRLPELIDAKRNVIKFLEGIRVSNQTTENIE